MAKATKQLRDKDVRKQLTAEMAKTHALETDVCRLKEEVVRLHHLVARWVIGDYEI